MKKKKLLTMALTAAMAVSLLAGCSKKEDKKNSDEVVLTIASFSPQNNSYFASADLEAAFQKTHPNVKIELEEYKDITEYSNAMKIRTSAKELPDIMFTQPNTLAEYKDVFLPLTDMNASKISISASDLAIDGDIYALPTAQTGSYVFYWKDLFAEAGVTVPDTWQEFSDCCVQLKDYYTKQNPDFIALALGAKDVWPLYTYSGEMPQTMSGNATIWDDCVKQDDAFVPGTTMYEMYKKLYDLFQQDVCGADPLGIGHDQVAGLFAEKKAAMLTFGPAFYNKLVTDGIDCSQLGTFFLPARDSKDDQFNTVAYGSDMIAISNQTKHEDIAKDFIEFFFSDDWYPGFIEVGQDESAITTYTKKLDPVLQEANDLQPDAKKIAIVGGGEDYIKLMGEIQFDYNQFASKLFIKDLDFDKELSDLNSTWNKGRASLGF